MKKLAFILGVLSSLILSLVIFEFQIGVEELMILTQKFRIALLLLLPLIAAVACFLLELGFKHQRSLAVSQVAVLASLLLALSFLLEQHQTGSSFYQEFPKSDFGVGELKSLRFKVDLHRSTFLVVVTLLVGLRSIGGSFINRPDSHSLGSLTQTVIFFVVQVVVSNSFLQTLVCWCGLSFSCQLLSFFYSGGTEMKVWWGTRSRNGCYPMILLCLFIWAIYRNFDYDFVISLAALSSSARLTGLEGGAGLRLMDVMSALVLFAALGPALEALLYHAFSSKQTLPRVYFLEVVVMGAVGCFLLQSWSVLLKHSSIFGPVCKLLMALFLS